MDLEGQVAIKNVVEKYGHSNDLVVLLGSPNAESSELYAETVTIGDPAYSGALAGVELRLPVFHIVEPCIKQQIDPAVYEREVGVMENVLDATAITAAMERVRERVFGVAQPK